MIHFQWLQVVVLLSHAAKDNGRFGLLGQRQRCTNLGIDRVNLKGKQGQVRSDEIGMRGIVLES